jgi:hypothetical protein
MRPTLFAVAALAVIALGGCSKSSDADDNTVKPGSGVALNPSGRPQDAQAAAFASQMQKAGDAMNAARQRDAAAMAAARARAGAK